MIKGFNFKNRAEWLKHRKKGLGGSDVAVLLGLSNFRSRLELWLDKTGRVNDSDESSVIAQRGQIMEKHIAKRFAEQLNIPFSDFPTSIEKLTGISKPKYEAFANTEHEAFLATPDYWGNTGTKGIIEIKSSLISPKQALDSWYVQTQWYANVLEFDIIVIAWLNLPYSFDDSAFVSYPDIATKADAVVSMLPIRFENFKTDKIFGNELKEIVRKFWDYNVKQDIPPLPITRADLKIYLKHRKETIVSHETNKRGFQAYSEYLEVKNKISMLNKRKTDLENQLIEFSRGADSTSYNGTRLFSFKPSKRKSLDMDKLKRDGLYEQYAVETESVSIKTEYQ